MVGRQLDHFSRFTTAAPSGMMIAYAACRVVEGGSPQKRGAVAVSY
jgi:hypothetical protein